MNLTPDALILGPLVLEWGRLSLVVGLIAFMTLSARGKNAHLERGAWLVVVAALIAGRIGYAFASGTFEPSLIDPRVGGLSWLWAAVGAVLSSLIVLRREALKLVPAGLIALVVAFVPQLLRPAVNATPALPSEARLEKIVGQQSSSITWGALPKPVLVNVWATWCGPCRLEMPLLAKYANDGARVLFLNAGEDATTIRRYLETEKLPITVYRDLENLRSTLQVSGLPTSLVIGTDGRVIARHMGALDRAQLEGLLGQVK